MRETLDFLLQQWLDVGSLPQRPRFAEHSAETFGAVLDTCERIARERYAPFNRLVDTEEPRFDGERVHLPRPVHEAWAAYAESGMLAASQGPEVGGMQLPYVIESAGNAFFSKAAVSIGSYAMLGGGTTLFKDVPAYVMASGNPAIPRGMNFEGMKRKGWSSETINALRKAYKVVFRDGITLDEAYAPLAELAATAPEVQLFIDTLRASTRGIVR